MKTTLLQRSTSLLAGCLALAISSISQAQVLDAPTFYPLPPIVINNLNNIPTTMNAGDIDSTIVSDIGDQNLNDLVIMANAAVSSTSTGVDPDNVGRIWTLVHSSGSDTQALQVASPVDIPIFNSDVDQCYNTPSSVQILDLDGDDLNDLAFISSCGSPAGPGNPGRVFGIQGNNQDPFQDANSLTVLGSQLNATFLPPIIFGSQPALASGDYDGDGRVDLGFFDFDNSTPEEQIHALLNDGVIGDLPDVLSSIDGPISTPIPLGSLVESGDFDNNGTQDMAVAFLLAPNGQTGNALKVYSGNGDGSFNPNAIAEANLGAGVFFPQGLTSGDFDGNGFLDFAVSILNPAGPSSSLAIVLCNPGNPSATCVVSSIPSSDPTFNFNVLDSADFDGDGLDDLVNIYSNFNISSGPPQINSTVQLRLNQGGSFDENVDQTFTLNTNDFSNQIILHLVAKDLDACAGPDLAYTGAAFTIPNAPPPPGTSLLEYEAGVAFNPNEAPVADAGPDNGTRVNGGIQLGGNPTCSDPTNDVMEIAWTQISGQSATLNDATAANPIITSASGTADAVFQVTCTDACGLSDSDTVTVDLGLIQGSGTCSLNSAASGFSAAWLMIPAVLGLMTALRRKKL